MRLSGRIFIVMLFLAGLSLPLFVPGARAATGGDEGGILVGRISDVEGGYLLRYVAEKNDWVATVQDAPFGLEDALYAERETKAEFIMPNGTWIRIGGDTQVQMIALDPEATVVDVASGLARMYNKNPNAIIKATTPFGYVTAPEGAVFDLYVGDESLEVIAVRGTVDFVHEATGTRYQVQGDASLIADSQGVSRGNGTVDAAWDDWNGQRDSLWAQRLSNQGQGAAYLPEPIRDQSYALEENGQWENVYYDGDYYPMWRPTSVGSAWSPFTEGRWSVYYDDNCWIPAEPFGYVTHHYGSWVWVEPFRRWYWRPPVLRVAAASPRLFIAFGWYPGRVGWIHSGSSIGWVPLAPYERYYAHRPWGRSAVVINQRPMVSINISQYRYLDRAVIISSDRLYGNSRYTPFVQRPGRTAIVKAYKPAAVVDKTVIRTFDSDNRRFAFGIEATRKPHANVLTRIDDNRRLARNTGAIGRQQIQQAASKTRTAPLPTAAAVVSAPVLSSKMVDAAKVNQPLQSVSFPKQEMKPQERQRQLNTNPGQMTDQRGQARPVAGGQNDAQRTQSVRDARDQIMRRNATAVSAPATSGPAVNPRPAMRDQGTSNPISRAPLGQNNEQRIRSPREMPSQERNNPSVQQRQQPRSPQAQQQTPPQMQQQEAQQRLQPQETQRRQQDQQQRLQQQEMQRRQQEEAQRQQQEVQRRQQDQQQRLQQQEIQRRQQEETQRQQQEVQRRQQQEQQQRLQQQEMQRRQQEETQRQQQEVQRRQQQEQQQRLQQQEMQRRQEDAQRQQQEMQRRQQQEEQQRLQRQETQRHQREEAQKQQEEAQKQQQDTQDTQQDNQRWQSQRRR